MNEILVLYYSKSGSVKEMSSLIARGINSVDGAQAKIRTVPEISTEIEKRHPLFQILDLYMLHWRMLKIALDLHLEALLDLEIWQRH